MNNIFEGVDTSSLDSMFWILIKMVGIYIVAPAVVAALISKFFRLSNKWMAFFITFAGIVGLYYLATHFEEVHNWLK